jgi:hypothetical protein
MLGKLQALCLAIQANRPGGSDIWRGYPFFLYSLFEQRSGYLCRRRRRGVLIQEARFAFRAPLPKGTRVYAFPEQKVEADWRTGEESILVALYTPESHGVRCGIPPDSIRWIDPERVRTQPAILDSLFRSLPFFIWWHLSRNRGFERVSRTQAMRFAAKEFWQEIKPHFA